MEWQEAPGVRDSVLARTWCRLVIEAGGRLVTEAFHAPTQSARGGVYGSALPLCQWIVENWWFLLNESYRFPARFASSDLAKVPRDRGWVQRHSLLAAREGYALPDLTLHRDGHGVIVRWMPDGKFADHPVLRFTGEGETHLSVAEAEQGLAGAVHSVLDRLEGMQEPEVVALREDWAAVAGATEQERRLCEWSARLGVDPFDPDELTDDLEEALRHDIAMLDAPLRHDYLDAAEPGTLRRDLEWLRQADALAADAGPGQSAETTPRDSNIHAAHRRGYDCAMALRQHLWPADGQGPIKDLDDALARLGWAQSPSRVLEIESDSRLEASVTRSRAGAPVAIVGEAGNVGNRFRLARSAYLHHFTGSGLAQRRLVTEAHTFDQRASRAFAAEFLAPRAGIDERLRGRASPAQIEELAAHYDVSSWAIGHQIQNHRLAWISDS